MRKMILLFFSIGLFASIQAQTNVGTDPSNNPLTHYSIKVSGAYDLTTAKENNVYEYLQDILLVRPKFDPNTGLFEVNSQVHITLTELNNKLTTNGFHLSVVSLNKSDVIETE
jgi:hypothetical protein